MKWFSFLLLPFSFLYGSVLAVRNLLFNLQIFKSYSIQKPAINVGNLSAGGTGKSPHVLYLADLLKDEFNVATLSRGYGRKTKGFFEVTEQSLAEEVGDEPLMFKRRLKENALVLVDEKRARAAEKLDADAQIHVVILDDAFQHRKVKAGFNILLTEYAKPYFKDFVLPAGRLREFKIGRKRAHCVIVTKCPDNLNESVKSEFVKKLAVEHSNVFFSKIDYGQLIPFGKEVENPKSVLLVTGIAHPELLRKHLEKVYTCSEIRFPDHHNFTANDIAEIHAKFDKFELPNAQIVTTEKDFVRIYPLLTEEQKQKYPWYYQAISVQLDREEAFNELIKSYVRAIPTIS